MNDDDLTILASAYLDGDVTADERAQVEASDELLLEVDRLRTVRAVRLDHSSADAAPISTARNAPRHRARRLGPAPRQRTDRCPARLHADRRRRRRRGRVSRRCRRRLGARQKRRGPAVAGLARCGRCRPLIVVMAGGLVLRNNVRRQRRRRPDERRHERRVVERRVRRDTIARRRCRCPGAAADAGAEAATEPELDDAAPAAATVRSRTARDVDTDLAAEAPPSDDGVPRAVEHRGGAGDLRLRRRRCSRLRRPARTVRR